MAAPTETSIANAALVLLGERRINSLDDNTKGAMLLKERYSEVRDNLLRKHTWNFSTKRVAVAVSATPPVWGFANAYPLPTDFLRLINIDNQANYPFQIEGTFIVTDHGSPLNLVYSAKITAVIEMDVMFREALAAALAADVAEAFTGSTQKVEQLEGKMNTKIREGRTPDGQEHSPNKIEASEYLDAREEQGFVRTVPTGPGTPL